MSHEPLENPLPDMPLPPELPPEEDGSDRAEIEREVRAKIYAEVTAARDRWAPGPDHASQYRRGINLALMVIDGQLDQPLPFPLTMTAVEIGSE